MSTSCVDSLIEAYNQQLPRPKTNQPIAVGTYLNKKEYHAHTTQGRTERGKNLNLNNLLTQNALRLLLRGPLNSVTSALAGRWTRDGAGTFFRPPLPRGTTWCLGYRGTIRKTLMFLGGTCPHYWFINTYTRMNLNTEHTLGNDRSAVHAMGKMPKILFSITPRT